MQKIFGGKKILCDPVTWCIEYAAQAERETGLPEVQMLDELDLAMTTLFSSPTYQDLTLLELEARRIGLQDCQHWTNILLPWVCGNSFLHLATVCGLHKYLSVKLEKGSGDFRHPITPLLDIVLAEYTTLENHTEKPHCSSPLLSFDTIQLLLDKGDDPHHISRSRDSEECGRTPWQILLSERRPGMRGSLSDWLKITDSFTQNGASGCSHVNKPVWIALRKPFLEDMQRLEAMIGSRPHLCQSRHGTHHR
ncbi:hypothetical protein NA56DRAFT_754305 [Hyaloscypha hepaticicola]|uniref:Uncharacterized protein n=1 Tax=Hyaloscypha hepaticicola TaxID=2082293 RepID=A0A2J6PLZ5_9HELO|nr:hypothetical protein NA56DRAFT_754305 [Hyaloscypha hepaticicola]